LQYRLSEEKGVTLITFRHSAFGVILEEYREGVKKGWSHMHEQVRKRAESSR
jgi:hypothetical protein